MQTIKYKFILALSILGVIMSCGTEDDGVAPSLNLPVLTASDLSISEDDFLQVIELPITLTGDNTTNVLVDFAAVGLTAGATDYEVVTPSPLLFRSGETSKAITIKVIGDEVNELKESFQIKFYNPKNATILKDLITIEIKDDDDNTQGLIIPTTGYTTPRVYAGYSLTWEDEFAGDSLNAAWWSYDLGDGCPANCGWGNKELQFYRKENTVVNNGNLIITAKKQNFGGRQYTSSRLVTKGKKFFKFGRVDIRAALPKGQGVWPALWMLGTNIDAVSWPSCGEIDIMELRGDIPNKIDGTVHFGNNNDTHQYRGQPKYLSGNKNFQDEFHVFTLLWEADKIEFLVDDELFYTVTPTTTGMFPYPFNKNFFFIFNVAVGGEYPGNPDATTAMPQSMIVDYVRVFSK